MIRLLIFLNNKYIEQSVSALTLGESKSMDARTMYMLQRLNFNITINSN